MLKKIKNFEEIKKIFLNRKKKKIVLCHGTFDLLHLGHINHLHEAKKYGDILVVSLTADKFINKGPGRPHFNSRQRAEALSALEQVDYVTINKDFTSSRIIKFLKPDVYCKGPDYRNLKQDVTGEIKNEIAAVKSIGGKIAFTTGSTFSSSKLINIFTDNISKLQKASIKKINNKYSFSQIQFLIEKLKKLKVLVIGETIIDEYNFCEALGKSGKDPFLVFRDIKTEKYLGGSIAIARHLSQFCKKVRLLSVIGEKKEYLSEIRKGIESNLNFDFITKKNSRTILKKRYIDNISLNKVLGVYKLDDEPLSPREENIFKKKIKKLVRKFDVVIVSDYGHGFISKKNAKIICSESKFLAVNAQINAANSGYNSMNKYKNCELVIVNEKEIRQEFRDKNRKVESLMKKLLVNQKIKNLVVTRGVNGSILLNKKNFYYSDGFAKKAVDKIGAGDAMLSVIALCLKSNFSKELSLLLGSIAGAQSVEQIGNKESINKIKIIKALEHILKY